MPVPTDTFYNIKKLNVVFAVSAVLLLLATAWLVIKDYNREWRKYQRQTVVWQLAMTTDAQTQAQVREYEREIEELQAQIAQAEASLPHDRIAALQAELAEIETFKSKESLPIAAIKGEIGPLTQQIERAELEHGKDSPVVAELRARLAETQAKYDRRARVVAEKELRAKAINDEIRDLRASIAEIERAKADAQRKIDSVNEQLNRLRPQGINALASHIRNAPLLDWFNPSEKVQQVVVPDIRTDLNFLSVETIDRCASCHFNIADPRFDREELVRFMERQVAQAEQPDIRTVERPVVMVEFWARAAEAAVRAGKLRQHALDTVNATALTAVNAVLGDDKVEAADLVAGLERSLSVAPDSLAARHYVDDLRSLLQNALGNEQYTQLFELYRVALTERYNAHRKEQGLATVSADPVLLAHPKLDLYVEAESKHPMKTMGCTACHEGSGQETQFEHTAHTPREMWVDAQTGVPVPDVLIRGAQPEPKPQAVQASFVQTAHAAAPGHDAGMGHEHAYTHQDVNLLDPHNPAPFAPVHIEATVASYESPAAPGTTRKAVRQAEYWKKKYHWHAIHYMHWEKPMHQLDYVESSCARCHTEIYDIMNEAPKLFEGRKLFAQVGCANCHAVEDLNDDLDIKKVGPSLVHVKEKLSPQMAASWVWAPKAFRPTTKMPHYFMLENNSSPIDILRTRTEVTAITYYLMTAPPPKDAPEYKPEPAPESAGDVARGRALFLATGCLACHTNLDEHGEQWIVEDLVARTGISAQDAKAQYASWTYNQRHTYAKAHLEDKLELTGPELSGVGTKLLAGRTEAEARTWLYNWVRHPRHYNDYTIMPSFRLDETDANDLAAYLLSLKRPDDWKADAFGYDDAGQPTQLDERSRKMLAELIVHLKSAQTTVDAARSEVAAMSTEDQLMFLGQKMISHYGCNGCHAINGFENAASACTNLDDWGLKDPHKLDFGYFDHAFDTQREEPFDVYKVAHEGLGADAPSITPDSEQISVRTVAWEHMDLERRPWLYHKLHNTRVYDRGRTSLEGDIETFDIGRPYDKLKMPKFFLNDRQVDALVTYVTGVRKPLVSSSMQQAVNTPARTAIIRGRQVATLYNCYGCHNVEGNDATVWKYYDARNPDGTFNYQNLVNAPPRLVGQGSKTQPDWLVYFLQNVHPIRPWLKIRMPSFFEDGHPEAMAHATAIADYFAAWAQTTSGQLESWIAKVEDWQKAAPADRRDDWFKAPALATQVEHMRGYAVALEYATAVELDPRQASEAELRTNWARVLKDMKFLAGVYDVDYPFTNTPRPANISAERFARGEALFNELRCYQCHAFGDEETLKQLFELSNPGGATAAAATQADAGDDYGDYGDEAPKAEPKKAEAASDDYGDYGDDSGYGEGETTAAAPTTPTVEIPQQISHPALAKFIAPNFSLTARRLQWSWVDATVQAPALTIARSAQMPQFFADGDSAFAKYPAALKDEKHAMFGYTGPDQRALLLDFIYASGLRNYTPGAEKLSGQQRPTVELKPLEKPAELEQPAKPAEQTGDKPAPAEQATAPSEPAAAAPAAKPEPKPAADANKSAIELHEGTQAYSGTRVVGVVKFAGTPPRPRRIDMAADPMCVQQHDVPPVSDVNAINRDGTMPHVLVYVKSPELTGPAPAEPAVLNQAGCIYHPHVLGVVAGQNVLIRNSDSTLHNVNFKSQNNGGFNIGQPVPGMEEQRTMSRVELEGTARFRCDVHPWMGAVLYVLPHPYFGVSDVEGRFEITGLPPGKYTLEARHESPDRFAPVTFEVEVKADTSTRVDATLQ